MDLNYYTRMYDDFLEPDICDDYVKCFEETLDKDAEEVKKTSICTGPVRPDGHQICGSCNCQRMNPMGFGRFENLNRHVMPKFSKIVDKNMEDVKLHQRQWPNDFGWEEFRMKRFLVSDGSSEAEQFSEHVDALSHEGAKRLLILMVYLNDDFNGGETEFPIFGDKIKPKKGRILIFPPTWNYLHKGNPPLGPGYAKYFLMTYVNYIDLNVLKK